MKRILYILIVFTVLCPAISAQTDSLTIFGFDDFMDIVKSEHPVSRQADLQLKEGDAAVLKSKGAFDPEIFTDAYQKSFDGKQYYSLVNGGLRIPTWFGMELKGGYQQNEGAFLNPENRTPAGGLWYAGISLPLGQGLFIDERRAELQKAELFKKSNEAERQLMLNKLLFEAGKVYWDWFTSYHILSVYEEALQLTEERYRAIKQEVLMGDRAAIDTVEAGIQMQNRVLSLQQANLDLQNATALLSVFLWADGSTPLEVASGTVPVSMDSISAIPVEERYYMQLDTLISNHPGLRQYRYEIDRITIDKRLKKEQLKPVLNLNFNPVTEPVRENFPETYNMHNYTWGLEFGIPIFLRHQRGDLQLAKVKLKEAQLDAGSARATLSYQAKASLNDWSTTHEQIKVYDQTVRDYDRLLAGEWQMFRAGESSLFMVNSREMGYINAQVELIKLLSKNRKANLAVNYAFGDLTN